jgi:hypothetical protein
MPTQFARAGRSQACVAPLPSPVFFAVSECVEVVACVHEVVLGEMKVLGGLFDGRGGRQLVSAQSYSRVPSCGCESHM